MESEIVTGKKLNEAKNNTTDEALEEVLKNAQEQLNRDMGFDSRIETKEKEERDRAVKKKFEQKKLEREKIEAERIRKEQEEKAAREKAEEERLAREKAQG